MDVSFRLKYIIIMFNNIFINLSICNLNDLNPIQCLVVIRNDVILYMSIFDEYTFNNNLIRFNTSF